MLLTALAPSRMNWSAANKLSVLVAISFAVVISGCAHNKNVVSNKDVKDQNIEQTPKTATNITVSPQGDIYVRGMKLQNSKFDFPITINSRVEFWLDYFEKRGRKHFAKYLERSELFVPYIVPILKQNGMPEDLVYLAMIESGFNNHARSRAKAVGPWQFISATGKRYGLMINWWTDERRDTYKSTLSAVSYLKDLYGMFQSWELASAAYNAGESKIARAIRRFNTKDFWEISRHRFLRPETRDYVPKIIAAAIISKNRAQFGFPAANVLPHPGEAIAGDGEVVKVIKENDPVQPIPVAQGETIASVLREDTYNDYEDSPEEALNPALSTVSSDNAQSNDIQPIARPVPTPQVSRKGEVSGEALAEFEVQSPADLLKVARAAGLSYQTVKSLNPELLRWCTPPTVNSYHIKLPASVKDRFLSTYNHNAYPRKVQFLAYKVRRGENLVRIARHFGIKVDPISDLNGISPKMALRTGAKVLLPMPNDRSRSLAALEVRDPPEKKRVRRAKKYYKVSYKKRAEAKAVTVKRTRRES